MNKLLLNLIGCLFTVTAFAQQATWTSLPAGKGNYKWTYTFSGGLDPVLGGTFQPAGSLPPSGSGTIDPTQLSTTTKRMFLPQPISGSVLARAGNSGRPVFTIDGTTDALKFKASDGTNIGKFAVLAVDGATGLTSVNFTVSFDRSDAEWVMAIGNHADAASTTAGSFPSTSNYTATAIGDKSDSFTSFKWQSGPDGIQIQHGVQIAAHTGSTNAPVYTVIPFSFNIGKSYRLEFLCNNTGTTHSYLKKEKIYSLPSGSLHFWVDDVQMTIDGTTVDFPASVLGIKSVGTPINSFMLQGRTKEATATISAFNMELGMSPLPVSFASFSGKTTNNGVFLNWQTASETNNSHFDVLRFSDANTTPVKIGEVAGKGNSSSLASYSFTDNNPVAGVNYYQLQQVDRDGKSSLSKIVDVKAGLSSSSFLVYQSANKKSVARIKSEENATAKLSLTDLNGKILNRVESKLNKGDNVITLSEAVLTPGVYLSTLNLNGVQVTRKFIVNP